MAVSLADVAGDPSGLDGVLAKVALDRGVEPDEMHPGHGRRPVAWQLRDTAIVDDSEVSEQGPQTRPVSGGGQQRIGLQPGAVAQYDVGPVEVVDLGDGMHAANFEVGDESLVDGDRDAGRAQTSVRTIGWGRKTEPTKIPEGVPAGESGNRVAEPFRQRSGRQRNRLQRHVMDLGRHDVRRRTHRQPQAGDAGVDEMGGDVDAGVAGSGEKDTLSAEVGCVP